MLRIISSSVPCLLNSQFTPILLLTYLFLALQTKLSNLKNLDLMGNPVCESDEAYTEKVFELIPSLEVRQK